MIKPTNNIRTKEVILEIAKSNGMSENLFIESIKRAKCNGPFNPDNWNKYMDVIEKYAFFNKPKYQTHPPCPVCGGKQIIDGKYIGLYVRQTGGTGVRCEECISHFFIGIRAYQLSKDGTMTFEEAIKKAVEERELLRGEKG